MHIRRSYLADLGSAALVGGAFLNALPSIAAVLGVIWYLLMIWESRTVQRLLNRAENK
jgi:hypothetical protein